MRKLILASALTAAVVSPAASFGPRANPDDQFRFFWLAEESCYQALLGSGFNLFIYDYWGRCNFTRGTYSDSAAVEKRRVMDRILADDCDYIEQLPVVTSRDLIKKHPRLKKDRTEQMNLDVADPAAFAEAMKMTDLIVSTISNHPACLGLEPSSEVRDGARPSYRAYFAKNCLEETGAPVPAEVGDGRVAPHYLNLPDFPHSRVVDDDYRLLKFYKWYWRRGDGWNDYQTAAKKSFERQFGRKAMAMYDPIVRVPPLWGSGGEMTHGNQWTYPTPEPYNIRYVIAEQQAMARGTPGQRVMTMVQGISYRSRLAPKEMKVPDPPAWVADRPNVVYMTTPPDVMREALWTCFATKLDGVGVFAIRALFDFVPFGHPKDKAGYQFTNPETMPAISNVFENVGTPLGPLFKAIPERAPEVAMLESYASTFFANRGTWGWDGFIWQYGILADCAHLQPYVLYEEEIARDGIPPTVKVILAPHCDVLTKKTFDALVAFQNKGGLIVGDVNLVPGILPDIPVVGFKRTWKDGAADNRALHDGAARLKADLAPFYRPPADSDNEHIVTFVRTYRKADYVFAINDKREFGDYVGQWKMVMERGVPNEGRVTVRRTAGAVYDLVRHESVPFSVLPNGETEIPVRYDTNDGKVLLLVDKPLGGLKFRAKPVDGGARVGVISRDRGVMIPIKVVSATGKPFYGVVADGKWIRTIKGLSADSVRVINLADGKTY